MAKKISYVTRKVTSSLKLAEFINFVGRDDIDVSKRRFANFIKYADETENYLTLLDVVQSLSSSELEYFRSKGWELVGVVSGGFLMFSYSTYHFKKIKRGTS